MKQSNGQAVTLELKHSGERLTQRPVKTDKGIEELHRRSMSNLAWRKMTLKEGLGLTVLSLLLPCLLVLQAGCKTNPPTATELQRLQGTWEGVALNRMTPGGSFVRSADTITITIIGNSFHFHRDTNFWFETTIALPAGTNPQQLNATIKDNAPAQGSNAIGKVVVALCKIEGRTLTLAARGDGSEEAPTSFEDEMVTRYELQKVQPQKGQ